MDTYRSNGEEAEAKNWQRMFTARAVNTYRSSGEEAEKTPINCSLCPSFRESNSYLVTSYNLYLELVLEHFQGLILRFHFVVSFYFDYVCVSHDWLKLLYFGYLWIFNQLCFDLSYSLMILAWFLVSLYLN